MHRRAAVPVVVLLLSLFALSGCATSDESPSGTGTPGPGAAAIQQINTKQEALFRQFNDLAAKIGEKAAMDSVAKLFRADPEVRSALVGSQGIAVVFANGIKGGLFLKKLDSVAVPPPPAPLLAPALGKNSGTLDNLPPDGRPSSSIPIMPNGSFWRMPSTASPRPRSPGPASSRSKSTWAPPRTWTVSHPSRTTGSFMSIRTVGHGPKRTR